MASEIKVDTIVNAGGDNDTGIDLATNDQILLKVANATRLTMNSTGQTTIVGEGGTTTTNLQQGLAKCWFVFDATGTPSIDDSFNASSLDDDGTGQFGIHYTNNFATAHQSLGGDSTDGNASSTMRTINFHTATTSTVDMDTWFISSGSAGQNDPDHNRGASFGDLA